MPYSISCKVCLQCHCISTTGHKTNITARLEKTNKHFSLTILSNSNLVTLPSSSLGLSLPLNLAHVWQQVSGFCGTGVGAVVGCSLVFGFLVVLSACWREPNCQVCVCAFMLCGLLCWVCSNVVFLALWCALRCWWCLFLSLFTLLFLSPPPLSPILYINPCLHTSCSGAGTLVPLQPKLSPSTLPPFSTPPAPSPANGPPSPKFGRDTLSYCLKEINKTVKPRISSFRTLRRSVSHQRKRFGCQETSSQWGLEHHPRLLTFSLKYVA